MGLTIVLQIIFFWRTECSFFVHNTTLIRGLLLIGRGIFMHEERLAMSCVNNKSWITRNRIFLIVFFINCKFWSYKRFLQKLHRWIWAFCSHIDLCSSSSFATWNEPAIFYNRRAQTLFHLLHANLCLLWCSIHVYRCRIRTRYTTNT